jgi:hypothetical protein
MGQSRLLDCIVDGSEAGRPALHFRLGAGLGEDRRALLCPKDPTSVTLLIRSWTGEGEASSC